MDNATFKKMANDLKDVMDPILNKYGYEYDYMKGREKSDTEASLTVYLISTDQEAIKNEEENDFKRLCYYFDFEEADYRKEIVDNGKRMILIGFNPKARKNPCILKDVLNETTYVAPVEYVKTHQKK